MMKLFYRLFPLLLLLLLTFVPAYSTAQAAFLNLGADMSLKATAVSNPDMISTTSDSLNYYSQRLRLYMINKVDDKLEINLWGQSISPWGLEGSTTIARASRYPSANGSLWIEQAYAKLKLSTSRSWPLAVSVGRQPYILGDGFLVSDDTMGFDSIRITAGLPWKIDVNLLTAKTQEAIGGQKDKDINLVALGYNAKRVRYESAWIMELDKTGGSYSPPGASTSIATTKIERGFYDFRIKGDMEDAYWKLEAAMQNGSVSRPNGSGKLKLSGTGFAAGAGGRADTIKFGRTGVYIEWAEGTGDDPSTGDDEAFRPTYAKRWNGLERTGYGNLFAATVSDAFSPTTPFDPTKTGLPAGVSGIKTLALKIDDVPHPDITISLGFYSYKAGQTLAGSKKLGSELDMGVEYRYSDNIRFGANFDSFVPGDAFGQNTSRTSRMSTSAMCKF